MKLMFYFSVVIVHCSYAVEDETRSTRFVRSEKESALVGHVIKTFQVESDLECLIKCNRNLRCRSYNYKNSANGLSVCQLNNETSDSKPGDHVASLEGFYYYGPVQSPCIKSNPCRNGGTCKPESNHPTIIFTCQCTAEYAGKLCEELVSDPTSNFDINFPTRSNTGFVSLQKMPSLTSLTISLSVNLSENGDHTFISYATRSKMNAIFFHQRASRFYFWVNDGLKELRDSANAIVPTIKADGLWHHLVLTWDNTNGQTELYIDGVLKHSKTGLKTGDTIAGNGLYVLGNDQDSYGGGFVKADALVGSVSRVNIWNKVLPTSTINDLLRKCGNEVGTAVAWRDFRPPAASYNGMASFKSPSTCS